MTTNANVGWNKILAVCSAFIIPGISVAIMCTIWGTRIEDKLNNVASKQEIQDVKFEALSNKVDGISTKVDTISHRQELNKRDIDYRFLLQSSKK